MVSSGRFQDMPLREGAMVEVYVSAEVSGPKPRSIHDLPFAGMWKEREDMFHEAIPEQCSISIN
jgi:hypothetical protein